MVFCTDILDIITKDFFARKSNSRVDDPIDPAGQGVQEVVSTLLDALNVAVSYFSVSNAVRTPCVRRIIRGQGCENVFISHCAIQETQSWQSWMQGSNSLNLNSEGSGVQKRGLRDDVDVDVQAAAVSLRDRDPEGVQVPQRRAGGGRVTITLIRMCDCLYKSIGLFIQLPTRWDI